MRENKWIAELAWGPRDCSVTAAEHIWQISKESSLTGKAKMMQEMKGGDNSWNRFWRCDTRQVNYSSKMTRYLWENKNNIES